MKPEDMKAALDELRNTWESEFKARLQRVEDETKQFGEASVEAKTALDRVNSALDDIETRFERMALDTKDEDEGAAERKAFSSYLRKGANDMEPEARKALIVSDDTTGGFLAPHEYVAELLKGVILISPFRSLARVRTTSAQAIMFPKRTGTFAAQWVREQGTRTETTGLSYGLDEIPNHEMYALVDVSMQDIEDSAFDLEGELMSEFAEQFALAEGSAFISGNSVGKPEGLLTNADIETVPGGDASAITADGIIDLTYALKSAYARDAVYILKRESIGAIRKLVDGQGRYIWQPGLANDVPATILDNRYVEMPDMPTITGDAVPMAFGDFRRGYVVVDRIQMAVQRDPYTQATSGNIRYIARRRVGGQVVNPEAIKTLTIATS